MLDEAGSVIMLSGRRDDARCHLAYAPKACHPAAKGPALGDLLSPLLEHIRLLSLSDVGAVADWMEAGDKILGPMGERLRELLAKHEAADRA